MVVLIAGQIVHKPKTGRETRIAASSTNITPIIAATQAVVSPKTNLAIAQAPVTNAPPPVAPATNAPRTTYTPDMGPVAAMKRPFKFYEGLFAVDLHDVPTLGSPSSPQAMVSLFDYSCHHCRLMHPVIHEVQKAFSNDLVIISLPMPLDGKCNRTVTRTPRAHTNACEYARLGLAVWRANHEKHREFDDWMMTGAEPPAVSEAVDRAKALLGTDALVKALNDPWVERQLQFDIAIYEVAYRQRHGSMPQLIVGSTVSEGVRTREEVLKMLTDILGLKPQP
jgi:hypothetical protein